MHAEALSEAAGNSSSLSLLGGVFWYGSSISIIIYLSLIRGISSVADGENASCFWRRMSGLKIESCVL